MNPYFDLFDLFDLNLSACAEDATPAARRGRSRGVAGLVHDLRAHRGPSIGSSKKPGGEGACRPT
ncbi:hypothetical protein [uncultured Variovorax sp.]|uniref:hypothetical protein n=1 Tax=uncultured Variovorax sp. TaxID=114708 RepID=UPI0025DC4848|nr:hypothetical protein [uncultured Variovorax sp.]